MTTQALLLGGEVDRWEQAIYAFLAEKERRSGSSRTVQASPGCSSTSSALWARRLIW
ncbi:MAG TPA: hypothetical protein VFA32_02460 [Dehalococcoidia bacterium]|jgi:hypothetical protein|nr:hypothetical protein [Dehalococcoidia bacterium]